jgi:hypothetical protein
MIIKLFPTQLYRQYHISLKSQRRQEQTGGRKQKGDGTKTDRRQETRDRRQRKWETPHRVGRCVAWAKMRSSGLWKVLGGAVLGVSAAGGHYAYLKYKRANNQNPIGTGLFQFPPAV